MANFGVRSDEAVVVEPDPFEPMNDIPMPDRNFTGGGQFTMLRAIDGSSRYGERYCSAHGITDTCHANGEW